MDGIVDIQLGHLAKRLAMQGMNLKLDSPARAWLAQAGYDQAYGARPLKRVIQRNLENPLASLILEDRLREGQTVKVTVGEAGLVIDGLDAAAA